MSVICLRFDSGWLYDEFETNAKIRAFASGSASMLYCACSPPGDRMLYPDLSRRYSPLLSPATRV